MQAGPADTPYILAAAKGWGAKHVAALTVTGPDALHQWTLSADDDKVFSNPDILTSLRQLLGVTCALAASGTLVLVPNAAVTKEQALQRGLLESSQVWLVRSSVGGRKRKTSTTAKSTKSATSRTPNKRRGKK
jgi:hypothetical protein